MSPSPIASHAYATFRGEPSEMPEAMRRALDPNDITARLADYRKQGRVVLIGSSEMDVLRLREGRTVLQAKLAEMDAGPFKSSAQRKAEASVALDDVRRERVG